MNIKDFLMDNYIYIIIVIVLIIITIIGFLADKKKSDGKKVTPAAGKNNPGYDPNAGGQITYQPNANTMGGDIYPIPNGPINVQMNNMAPLNNQISPQPVQNNPQVVPSQPINGNMSQPVEPMNNAGAIPQPMNGMNNNIGNINQPIMGNAPQPVEPINNLVSTPEPMYQPLAEQQPNLLNNAVNQPVEQIGFQQPIINTFDSVPNNINQPINNFGTVQPQQMVPPMAPGNVMQPMPNTVPIIEQPQPMAMNNPIPGPEVNPLPPVNPVPMPGPVENTVPNPITPPQPVNPTPVGFVYGAQQQNNNNG